MNELAPIVLFVYNRPEHTKRTLKALQVNTLASDSELFICSDASKGDDSSTQVHEVRELIKNVSGFKSVTVIKQEKNQGLANSIINGVTDIVNKYGKIIVLEDDLVTSPYFLTFMNNALNFYEHEKKVWHISGWNYPINKDGLGDTFFWRVMNCWGWATWQDRWQYFEKNTDQLIDDFTPEKINDFNLDGAEKFWGQVLANKEGKINTWAIYWYACIFNNNGSCLNPTQTFVNNIGLDGSGIHCGENNSYVSTLNMNSRLFFSTNAKESQVALERIKLFYKKMKTPLVIRAINKVTRIIFKKNLII